MKALNFLKRGRKVEQAPAPAAAPGVRLYAVGDVHGCCDLLDDLLRQIELDSNDCGVSTRLIMLGDYVDRGPQSAQVLDRLINGPLPCDEHVFLRGNHEEAMVNFIMGAPGSAGWLQFGGLQAIESYGVATSDFMTGGKLEPDAMEHMRSALEAAVPAVHMHFLAGLQYHHLCGDYLFVHAGIRPKVPLNAQSLDDMMWIRDDFITYTKAFERYVVHGHTIQETPDEQPNRLGIDTGAYYTGVLTCAVMEGMTKRYLQTTPIGGELA